jgi:hypothetical protein
MLIQPQPLVIRTMTGRIALLSPQYSMLVHSTITRRITHRSSHGSLEDQHCQASLQDISCPSRIIISLGLVALARTLHLALFVLYFTLLYMQWIVVERTWKCATRPRSIMGSLMLASQGVPGLTTWILGCRPGCTSVDLDVRSSTWRNLSMDRPG